MLRKMKLLLPLFFIVILAFCIRIYQVGSAPTGILVDEASFGYNAYSILQTGKDEHSKHFPLTFKAFGDQKLPAYAYTLVPSVKVFGLTNFAVRLPSVIAGTALVAIMYFLLLEIGFSQKQSLLGSLIVAISPWSIILSRFGYESNVGLFFLVTAVLFAYKYVNNPKAAFAIFSGIFFGLTWYSYIAYRLAVPLILCAFIFAFYKQQKTMRKNIFLIAIIFFITIAPLFTIIFSKAGTARFNQVGLLSETGLIMEINENRTYCDESLPKIVCDLNANKPLSFVRTLTNRFIQTFSLDYLFLEGEKDLKHISVDHFGVLPYVVLPFYLIGLMYLLHRIVSRTATATEIFICAALIISVVPAVLSGNPQRVRLSPLFPFIIAVIIYGIARTEEYLKQKHAKFFHIGLVIACVAFVSSFMLNYLTIHLKKYEMAFGNHIPKIIQAVKPYEKNRHVYIKPLTEGIMYYAYFSQIDPKIYQSQVVLAEAQPNGFQHAKQLGAIHIAKDTDTIQSLYCTSLKENVPAIYVTNDDLEASGIKPLNTIKSGPLDVAFIYDVDSVKNTTIDCSTYKDLN